MEPAEPRKDRVKRNSREMGETQPIWTRHQKGTETVAEPVTVLPESARWKVDTEHMLGLTGIVSTVLNLVVVVLVYLYTPI